MQKVELTKKRFTFATNSRCKPHRRTSVGSSFDNTCPFRINVLTNIHCNYKFQTNSTKSTISEYFIFCILLYTEEREREKKLLSQRWMQLKESAVDRNIRENYNIKHINFRKMPGADWLKLFWQNHLKCIRFCWDIWICQTCEFYEYGTFNEH